MRRELLFSIVLGLAFAAGFGVQELTQTFVVNLENPHPIVGDVAVSTPIPHSDMVAMVDIVVAPAGRTQTSLWTEVGSLTTEGFTSAVLSLHGQLRGSTGGGGVVAVVLVPEEENILRALDEGEVHLELEAIAEPAPGDAMYFSGSRAGLPIAFPKYRVFLYNTTDRSASVDVYAYLIH